MSLLKSSRRRLRLGAKKKITTRLNFEDMAMTSPPKQDDLVTAGAELSDLTQFDMELDDHTVSSSSNKCEIDTFSPCRTRSGRVYESGLKKRKFRSQGSEKKVKKVVGERCRAASGQSGTGHVADCSDNGSDNSDEHIIGDTIMDRLAFPAEPMSPTRTGHYVNLGMSPPPLNYEKYPVSRMYTGARERKYRHDILSSPIHNQVIENELSSPITKHWNPDQNSPSLSFSPPTNTMQAMCLFDGHLTSPNTACALTSPRSTPRFQKLKSRLVFDEDGEYRRASLPNPQTFECDTTTGGSCSLRKSANINPFTPSAMLIASKKRSRNKKSIDSSTKSSSHEELQASLDSLEDGDHDEEDVDSDQHEVDLEDTNQAKRIRVSDINITRYEFEFLELEEIASGQFGEVKKARHRLDGIVYAIKVSKKAIRVNSHDEKMAMNEVFAHAAMMKHKHVVRYYNSWVEKGQVYIQNEFCEGGSLQTKIDQFRAEGTTFSETELKKIIIHVCKGLQYIHSQQLVHLDIKPENIFISLEPSSPSQSPKAFCRNSTDPNSTDSGNFTPSKMEEPLGSPGGAEGDKVNYKIGDLGHVASVWGGFMAPEEGDCRYMAPELLQMEPERSYLPKADMFSLGLTMFAAASLQPLPRNSSDGPLYERLKSGDLPYLDNYSKEFNNLLKSMVSGEHMARPTAARLLTNTTLIPGINKTRSQLCKELQAARDKVAMLELQLQTSAVKTVAVTSTPCNNGDKENSMPWLQASTAKRMVGRGAVRSTSCLM